MSAHPAPKPLCGMRTVNTMAEASLAYGLIAPSPLWAEIDANYGGMPFVKQLVKSSPAAASMAIDVAGIGVDGVGWTLVPLIRSQSRSHPAMIWLDRRAQAETDWLNGLSRRRKLNYVDAEPVDPAFSITPKLLWLKQHRPQILTISAYRFLTASGFIVGRLTDEFTCDFTQAYGYHFFDIAHERWDGVTADQIGVPFEKMPRLCACTEIIGGLTERAARELGLQADIPVIAGCLDAYRWCIRRGSNTPRSN